MLCKPVKIVLPLIVLLTVGWLFFSLSKRDPFGFKRQTFMRDGKFFVGVNYPWLRYGEDFGSTAGGTHNGVSNPAYAAQLDADFSELEAEHLTVVRWWLWADGRGGLTFNHDGSVSGVPSDFYTDMDVALACAKRHHVRIMFVMLDFLFFAKSPDGPMYGGHAAIASNAILRQSFLDNAVKPVLLRYGKDNSIVAWDVVNEPEWELDLQLFKRHKSPVKTADMLALITAVSDYVHRYSNQLVTVGSAERRYVQLWTKANLDFYQFHTYPAQRERYGASYFSMGLDKPCVIGEFPTKRTGLQPSRYLGGAYDGGYAGAMLWSFRGNDDFSNYPGARADVRSWMRQTHGSVLKDPSTNNSGHWIR